MGIKVFVIHSFGHLFYGSLSFILIDSLNLSKRKNFILANGIHLLMEIIEKRINRSGKILESTVNQISDIIIFFIGWFIALSFNLTLIYNKFNIVIKIILWSILILEIFYQVLREIFPDFSLFNGLIKGAYVE